MEKLIHRFWAGPKELPNEYARFGLKWTLLNPGFKVLDWTEDIVHDIHHDWPEVGQVLNHLYERDAGRQGIELYVQIADIVGYYLPWKYGGYYFNMDMEPVRPFYDPMPNMAWASYENDVDGRIVNAAVGAPEKENLFWTTLLDALPRNYWSRPYDEMVMSTGPGFLTDQANLYPGMIHVFSLYTFNPVHWSEIDSGGDAHGKYYPQDTIAVHHWGHKKDGRSNVIETATR